MSAEVIEPSGERSAPRLLDRVRHTIRRRHYSPRTGETYVQWIRRFIYYSGTRHPTQLGAADVTAFLNYLAGERSVAAATQNQALSALLFLYRRCWRSRCLAERPGAREAARAPADGAYGRGGRAPAHVSSRNALADG